MSAVAAIYGLVDPRDGQLRYVGKTANASARLRQHIVDSATETTHKANWLKQLLALGLKPDVVVLEEAPADLNDAERFWIAAMRFIGCDLTNATSGGDGVALTPGIRAKMSEAARKRPSNRKGVKLSDEQRKRMSEARKGKPLPAEQVRKMAQALKARASTPEGKLALSKASSKRWANV